MNKAENDAYLEKAMSGIPEHFSGKLLEVPVGKGILTMPVYKTMPEADITCLDYSPDIATTLLPETENKRRSSYRSIADTSFETVKKPRRRCPGQSSGGCVRGAKSPPRVQSTGF